jgi:hypothetical protein
LGTSLTLPIGIYLIAPQGSEIARIGVSADLFDTEPVTISAPVQVRTSPTVGIDLPLKDIPNTVDGTSIQLDQIKLKLYGTVNGRPFTSNPTSCQPADTRLTIDSYAAGSPVSADASFTPTGCDQLPYNPLRRRPELASHRELTVLAGRRR